MPQSGPGGGAVVWLPLSRIVAGGAEGARLERLIARGLLEPLLAQSERGG